ncbi:Mechanosensitive ion channel family protein [Forsythia ovata]|uniref:Mechanosensitive ion channel family protein n=1 Tax=Forsythia ovata TaxID=205694 RepID=A0ABD1SJW3_9LAMI
MSAVANNKDFDFVTESPLSHITKSPSTNYGMLTPKEVRVLFNDNTAAIRDSNWSSNTEPKEVLVCSSNSSFQRKCSFLRTKIKSRLLDPPKNNPKSKNQIMTKSQVLGKGSEVDKDDPFLDEDLLEDYKKMKFSALQLVSLILIIAALVCSLTISLLKKMIIFKLELWK